MINRDIPEPIRRQLRQEAGFGCCACGYPFIEYHHIIPFSQLPEHHPENMIALCPIHHHQGDIEAIDEVHQRNWKREPYNIIRGFVYGQLLVKDKILAIEIATNFFVGAGFKFLVNDEPLLQIRANQDGRLLISLDLYDEDNNQLLSVIDNEWIMGDPLPWDFEFSENFLRLRLKERDIRIVLDARSIPFKISGTFWRHGQNFAINAEQLVFNGVLKGIGFAYLGLVALTLKVDIPKAQFSIAPDLRLGKGMFVSWPDPAERLKKSIDAYKELLHHSNIGRNEPCPCGSGKKWKRCCGA
jgi:hypothetical protein